MEDVKNLKVKVEIEKKNIVLQQVSVGTEQSLVYSMMGMTSPGETG